MSFTSFRNSFLTEAESRLDAVNPATASTTDLLMAGALYKMAAAVAEVDLIGPSALRLLETMTGAQLEAWLQDASNRDAFERILSSSEAMRAVAANSTAMAAVIASSSAWSAVVNSSTAMNAVAASSTAMAAVAASSTAMAAVAASSTAMDAVWASNTAADAVLTSATARSAIYESDTALARLQANPAQIARQIGIAGRTQYASTSLQTFDFVPNGTKVILLRRWYSGDEYDYLNWRRGATSTGSASGVIQPGGSRVLYSSSVWANGTVPGTYNDDGTRCNSESDHANFVAACNGLRRDGWYSSRTLYVRYITV
jgi:hypothetical protein